MNKTKYLLFLLLLCSIVLIGGCSHDDRIVQENYDQTTTETFYDDVSEKMISTVSPTPVFTDVSQVLIPEISPTLNQENPFLHENETERMFN